ncbi:hypothetical protein SY88_04140 [Clostridiales bacterium PH28_bin88]|nr:hypothetical protein SY88_04140 [Clostridiales bacterium PH28_bin88]
MSTAEAYWVYQQNQIKTASREKLVLLLYDGAIRFIAQAEKAWQEEQNIEKTHHELIRAQDIVSELMATLNREEGGEIAASLFLLYDYMLKRLVEANLKKDTAVMAEVRGLLSGLREAWQEAVRRPQGHNPSENRMELKG